MNKFEKIPNFYKNCNWCEFFKEYEDYTAECVLHPVYAYECPDFILKKDFVIPEENKIGKWLEYDHDIFGCRQIDSKCSICGHIEYTCGHECKIDKCPNCWAKMNT